MDWDYLVTTECRTIVHRISTWIVGLLLLFTIAFLVCCLASLGQTTESLIVIVLFLAVLWLFGCVWTPERSIADRVVNGAGAFFTQSWTVLIILILLACLFIYR